MDAGLVAVGIRRLSELLEEDIDTRKKKEDVGGSGLHDMVWARLSRDVHIALVGALGSLLNGWIGVDLS